MRYKDDPNRIITLKSAKELESEDDNIMTYESYFEDEGVDLESILRAKET